MDHENIMRISR